MPIVHDPVSNSYAVGTTFSRNGDEPGRAPALIVDHLDFSYPDGHVALRDVPLRVHHGEKVASVGPNGAGKSTLMLHLNGILSGDGHVEVAGLPVTRPNLPVIRAKVGLVFQNPDDQLCWRPTASNDPDPLPVTLANRLATGSHGNPSTSSGQALAKPTWVS